MKTIGLIGGLSWESSAEYYRLINEAVRARVGGLHSASIVMYSFDFAEIRRLQGANDWTEATRRMVHAARSLRQAGANLLAICSVTMHRMAREVEGESELPLVHIADVAGKAIKEQGLSSVGLLGSRFTMEEDFYRVPMAERFGIDILTPLTEDRATVDDVIFHELCAGVFNETSKRRYLDVIGRLQGRGAQGVILGCTEIPLLVKQEDVDVPLFDTTLLHAQAVVDLALAECAGIETPSVPERPSTRYKI